MKRLLRLWFVFVLILGCRLSTEGAAGIAGGDIGFTHLGNGIYRIVVTVFRDCSGNQLSSSVIKVNPVGTTIYRTQGTTGAATEIKYACPKSCTPCSNGSCSYKHGFQKTEVVDTVDL